MELTYGAVNVFWKNQNRAVLRKYKRDIKEKYPLLWEDISEYFYIKDKISSTLDLECAKEQVKNLERM